jgi:hypothetical protein
MLVQHLVSATQLAAVVGLALNLKPPKCFAAECYACGADYIGLVTLPHSGVSLTVAHMCLVLNEGVFIIVQNKLVAANTAASLPCICLFRMSSVPPCTRMCCSTEWDPGEDVMLRLCVFALLQWT